MRATLATATLFGALCAAGTALAQQEPDWSKVQMKTTHVAGSVYLLQGEGGNIAASIGADGIVIVDDQFAPLAGRIAEALQAQKLTDKPVRFVINTHYHFDHTGGNAPFAGGGATIIAQENVRVRLMADGTAGTGKVVSFPYTRQPAEALPVITFGQDLGVHLNGEDIRALHLPAGHTDGDAVIVFPQSNVVHMGDNFVRYGFPFIDVLSGGSVQGMIAGLKQVLAELPADVRVIPGHGEIATPDDVRAYIRMLEETSAVVQKALAAGKTLEQMQQEKLLEPWRAAWVPADAFIGTDAFLETLYNSLTGKAGGFKAHN
jgi:glyoxylase-like metal-dependent hydrolase (beta-lactamase superfamily II)